MKDLMNRLFRKISINLKDTPFAVKYWDGRLYKFGHGKTKFTLIFNSKNAAKRAFYGGSLGFGEEFMSGGIVVDGDLQQLVKLSNVNAYKKLKISFKDKIRIILNYFSSMNTLKISRKNIPHHYDLGNDFYSLWLDKSMAYTCAYFKSDKDTLETAQKNKYEHVCRKLQLKSGESMVDLGCGWGGLMFHAAENYGVNCEGYTLSKNQYDYILDQIKKRRLGHLVKVHHKDYRHAKGKFDKLATIGMFEHVGQKFYPLFFKKVKSLLKEGGIGIQHNIATVRSGGSQDAWIMKYIFPGGFLPTLSMMVEGMRNHGLDYYDVEDLRMHYARTLDHWIYRFEKNLGKVNNGKEFIQMWRLYLNGSAASFKYGQIRLYQVVFTNGAKNDLPLTREYMYNSRF